jgi:hypothetical protein
LHFAFFESFLFPDLSGKMKKGLAAFICTYVCSVTEVMDPALRTCVCMT